MITIVPFQSQDGRRGWPEHAHAFVTVSFEPLSQRARPLQRFFQLVAADKHIGQSGVWRIMHPTAEAELFVVESGEIVARGLLPGVVVLKISLQNYFAGTRPATGAASNLG